MSFRVLGRLLRKVERWPAPGTADCSGQGIPTHARDIGCHWVPTFANPQSRPPLPPSGNDGAHAWGRPILLAAHVATRRGAKVRRARAARLSGVRDSGARLRASACEDCAANLLVEFSCKRISVLHDRRHGRHGGASGRCGDSAGTNTVVAAVAAKTTSLDVARR